MLREQNKDAQTNVNLLISFTEDISEYETYAVMKTSDGNYFYNDAGAKTATNKISQALSMIDIYVKHVDEYYPKAKRAIDIKISQETNYTYRTWAEYRDFLKRNYYIDENMSNREKAKKIVSGYVDIYVD